MILSENDEEPLFEKDTDDGLIEALADGDSERVVSLLKKRTCLGTAEISVLIDLFEGSPENDRYYRAKLQFSRWKPGRPRIDPLGAHQRSIARAREVEKHVNAGKKQMAALALVSEDLKVSQSQLKKDVSRLQRHNARTGQKKWRVL